VSTLLLYKIQNQNISLMVSFECDLIWDQ